MEVLRGSAARADLRVGFAGGGAGVGGVGGVDVRVERSEVEGVLLVLLVLLLALMMGAGSRRGRLSGVVIVERDGDGRVSGDWSLSSLGAGRFFELINSGPSFVGYSMLSRSGMVGDSASMRQGYRSLMLDDLDCQLGLQGRAKTTKVMRMSHDA